MKKNRTTKVAIILLALVLATSCFVGSTFAKYTTSINGTDTARVAMFDVELAITTNTFDEIYDSDTSISVDSSEAGVNVIAPGTKKDDAITFTITGTPEVDVHLTVTLDRDDALSMVTLPAGDYKDYTDLNNASTYNVAAAYNPVKWTLKKDGAAVAGCENVNLEAINTYLEDTLSGDYNVTDTGSDFTGVNGTYTLSWTWLFEDSKDKEDTTLGQIQAGVITPAPSGYVANETFKLYIEVTQLDVSPVAP